MEFVNSEEVRYFWKFFLFFLMVPAVAWWCNLIIGFFTSNDEDNCCPHCHIHIDEPEPDPIYAPKPTPSPDLSGGGMAVPPMKIPEREKEYIRRK